MGLVIHHLRRSQSERIIWLCEELGVPYDLKCYNRDPTTSFAPPEYKALSHSQTSPVIQDGETVIPESAACIEYICSVHGGGRLFVKPAAPNYVDFLYWFHYAQGSLQPAMVMAVFAPGIEGPIVERRNTALNNLDRRLAESRFLAGDEFTAADLLSLFWFTTYRNVFVPLDITPWPNVVRWVGEVGSRPAYVRAMEKGDPGLELDLSAKGASGPKIFG